MSSRLPGSPIDTDIEELRGPILTSLCLLGIGMSWLWFAVAAVPGENPPPLKFLLPAVVMLSTSGICLLANKAPPHWRSALFLLGTSIALVLKYTFAPSLPWLYTQLIVISIAGLLSGSATLLALASFLTIASILQLGHSTALYPKAEVLPFLGLLWAITATSWLSSRNLYTALYWALDSQSRAWEIADEVRYRRGELRRALHSLGITNAILERTTRELEAARLEAEEARQVKSRFVANISHELRTPLNIIIGFAEMLCTLPETYGDLYWPPSLREDLLTIWRNAEHLLQMVDDVLDLAQIEARRLPILPEPTDLVRLIRDTLGTASALLKNSQLELRVSLPDTGPTLDIDATRIRQVLLNLINNSVRFTPGGHIEVGAYPADQEFIVYVRDSGVGIPEGRIEAIFQEFEQVDTSIRRPYQGAGLGLAISRHFIHLHGGRIWAESEMGVGSTFYFSLPTPKEYKVVLPAQLRRTRSTSPRPDAKEETIAVLCRDHLVVRMLERHMENLHILAAESVASAASLIQEQHPEAALIATDSPDDLPAAIETAQALSDRVAPFDLPIVVCTFPTERRAGAALDADEFLIKPVTRGEVVGAIRQLCETPRCVLVVDDEPDMLRLLALMVRQEWEQAQVLTAVSGSEAIALLPQRPDVILLDLLMPGVSGTEVLAALRSDQDTANVPVVIVTARGPAEDLAARPKGSLYILKNSSFTAGELMHCLEALTKSLPPRYVTRSASVAGIREAPLV